jgi:hypothetical protein
MSNRAAAAVLIVFMLCMFGLCALLMILFSGDPFLCHK